MMPKNNSQSNKHEQVATNQKNCPKFYQLLLGIWEEEKA
jgi:hypothetical protein